MIRVATIAFRRKPEFDILAPGQPVMAERIDYALKHDPKFLHAKEEEEKLKGMTPKEREEYKRLATRLTGSASRCEIWRCVLTGFRPSTLRARPEFGH